MKTSRSLMIWLALALCAVMVLGAMTWLTRGMLASEHERAEAEARADLEERTRLALWRMDAFGAAIIAGENRHPPGDYKSNTAFSLTENDPLVKLHFELFQNGGLSSPELDPTRKKLTALRSLLSKNPLPGEEWSLLICAAEAGEDAWKAVPKDAAQQISDNSSLRLAKGGAQVRQDAEYQTNFNNTERTKRAGTVSNSLSVTQGMSQNDIGLLAMSSGDQIVDLGAMRAVWVGSELLLLRQLKIAFAGLEQRGVQGVWLDHEILKKRLLFEIKDLLPEASLSPETDTAADPLALVSFPLQLLRNEAILQESSKITGPLIIGWFAVLLAIGTASSLVHGVMRLSERRASFVSAVTHELRTPLTTFRLYSDMLVNDAVKPEKRGDYLQVLSREADRLSHLVENVLSFSKIERGSAKSVVREATVSDLLESMRERLEGRLATAGMTLAMNITCQLRVRVDSAAMEHILFNLIDNAAKYASSGNPPEVVIGVHEVGRILEITVSDNGPGIPASEHRRIFRAFHKSAREAAESRPGVGLGLALSRRLAKSLGGGLECFDSKQGACFVLRLPLA